MAKSKRWVLYLAGFWLLVVVGCSLLAHSARADSQAGGYLSGQRNSSAPYGHFVGMWNASNTTIAEGTLVMVDTAAAPVAQIPVGKGFIAWSANPAHIDRIVGVTTKMSAGNSWCPIMVDGFFNNALMDSTGCAGMALLRPSLKTAGALHVYTPNPDSLNAAKRPCGVFQRYASTSSLAAWVFVRMNWLGR